MAFDALANFARSQVVTAPSPAVSGTSLVVLAGQGARFPAVSFNATVTESAIPFPPEPSDAEVVRVTAISTDTLTITRAQESSSARSIAVGDWVQAVPTAKTFTDTQSMAGAYKTLMDIPFSVPSATVAGTYYVNVPITISTGSLAFAAEYLNPADFAVTGLTTKYRVLANGMVNATAPSITLTFGLYPVTANGGTVGNVLMTAGTVTSGSTQAVATPSASAAFQGNSGDFTAPAANYFALGVVLSGTVATNSTTHGRCRLQVRNT